MPVDTAGVIWDLDGVIVDTAEMHYQTWRTVLAEEGFNLDRKTFQQTFGMNNEAVILWTLGEANGPNDRARIADRKERLFRAALPGDVRLYPGVGRWLKQFRAWDWLQAIASSAPPENIEALLAAFDLRGNFGAIVSGAELPSKPDPAVFLAAGEGIGIAPERCFAIEDSPAGIRGAREAGMRTIALTTTHTAVDFNLADLVLPSLDHLRQEHLAELLGA